MANFYKYISFIHINDLYIIISYYLLLYLNDQTNRYNINSIENIYLKHHRR